MFSIIVCSIRPEEAEALRKNVEATIGVPFEFIAFDNRNTGKGICQVYNECAEKAMYENLCFVHEDIEFLTPDWGKIIAGKLAEPDCGVIGFAGSAMKSKAPSGWLSTGRYGTRAHYIQGEDGREFMCDSNPYNQDFAEVVTLDGLCLFMAKDKWKKTGFDDKMLTGFHCYDIDLSLASHTAGLRNWVCNIVLLKHFSPGNYGEQWMKENQKLHNKWKDHLPLYVRQKPKRYQKYLEWRTKLEWTYHMGVKGLFNDSPSKYVLQYVALHPTNGRSFKLLSKYIRHKRSKKAK